MPPAPLTRTPLLRYSPAVAALDDDALVLDTHPFRERHLILSVLTHEHGTVRGVLRGARGGRVPRTAATQTLSLVRVSAIQPPHAERATFRGVDLLLSSFPRAADLERATAAAVTAELLATFCPPAQPAPLSFRLGRSVLEALLAGADAHIAVAYVAAWVLALGGVLPPLDRCTACGAPLEEPPWWQPQDGQPLCRRCAPPTSPRLDAADLQHLALTRRSPVAAIPARPGPSLSLWLDRLAEAEAERPLRALPFFRRLGGATG